MGISPTSTAQATAAFLPLAKLRPLTQLLASPQPCPFRGEPPSRDSSFSRGLCCWSWKMACALPGQMHDPPSRSTAAPCCSKRGSGRLRAQARSPARSQGWLGWLRTDRMWSLREGCVGSQWSTELPHPRVVLPFILPCSCKHIWLLHLTPSVLPQDHSRTLSRLTSTPTHTCICLPPVLLISPHLFVNQCGYLQPACLCQGAVYTTAHACFCG